MLTFQDVTTRGNYYPDKSMATAAVSTIPLLLKVAANDIQNPPLYLHVTSTTKQGLDEAVKKIEELMKQELPNLVDERRFRRREPDAVERDEFGRVGHVLFEYTLSTDKFNSASGRRKKFRSILSQSQVSISALRLLATAAPMSSTSSKRLDAAFKLREWVLDSWRLALVKRAMSPCTCMLRRYL